MKLNQSKKLTISWFFEKINKIDKSLATLMKRERKPELTKCKMKKEIPQQTQQKYRIIRNYFENLYSNNRK